MDFSGVGRAITAWRDRRTVQKFSGAAHVMNHAAQTDALLDHLTRGGQHMAAANVAAGMAQDLSKTSGKTAKRIDKLASNLELKAKVDKGLGLNQPEKGPWD